MADHGPLPRYLHARSEELAADRTGLPGLSTEPDPPADHLGVDEVEDIHLPLSLSEAVIAAASPVGGRVLDPFAGYGTTLLASHRLGRTATGIELLPEHVRISRARAPHATVIEGDARGLRHLVHGGFDLCFTAPPFLTRNEHPADPLTGYELTGGDYDSYLVSLTRIGEQIRELLAPSGYLVLNVANIRYRGETTRLAWDVAAALDTVIPFVSETAIIWDSLPHDFTGDYLLCFQERE